MLTAAASYFWLVTQALVFASPGNTAGSGCRKKPFPSGAAHCVSSSPQHASSSPTFSMLKTLFAALFARSHFQKAGQKSSP